MDLNVKTRRNHGMRPSLFHFEPHPAPGNVIDAHRLGGCQGKAPGVGERKCQNTSQDGTILPGVGTQNGLEIAIIHVYIYIYLNIYLNIYIYIYIDHIYK